MANSSMASGGIASGDRASIGRTSRTNISGVIIFFTSPRIVKRRHLTLL